MARAANALALAACAALVALSTGHGAHAQPVIPSGCTGLDYSGTFVSTKLVKQTYDIDDDEVLADQDAASRPERVIVANPDLPFSYTFKAVQTVSGTQVAQGSTTSMCVAPPVESSMTCVDSDDIGTTRIVPTLVGDDCKVLAYYDVYTEPGAHDCFEPVCQAVILYEKYELQQVAPSPAPGPDS